MPQQPAMDNERRTGAVAGLLRYGTWLASAVVAVGVALEVLRQIPGTHAAAAGSGLGLIEAGVTIFILLPIARVCLMLGMFLRDRDYLYAALSALVLAIIGLGIALGLSTAG